MTRRLFPLIILLFTLLTSTAARADGLGAAGAVGAVALGGKLLKDIIGEFEDAARRIMAQGKNDANLVLSHGGDEIAVQVQNLRFFLNDDINTVFENLNPPVQSVLLGLNQLIGSINNGSQTVVAVSDYMAMDLESSLGNLPFTSSRPYYIKRIDGLILPFQKVPFKVQIRGQGIGFNEGSKRTFNVKVWVDNTELPISAIQKKSEHDLSVIIPYDNLLVKFSDKEIVFIPVRIESEIKESGLFGGSTNKYSSDFNLMLLPRVAGIFELTYSKKEIAWDTKEQDLVKNYAIPSSSREKPFNFDVTEKLNDQQKIVGVKYDCSPGGPCGYCYHPNPSRKEKITITSVPINGKPVPLPAPIQVERVIPGAEYDPSFDIHPNGHGVQLRRYCDGAGVQLTWTIKYVEQITNTVKVKQPERLAVGFAPFSVDLPANTIDWALTGSLFTGQEIKAQKGNVGPHLQELSEQSLGDQGSRLTFKVLSPF